jgi:hypothetical protein
MPRGMQYLPDRGRRDGEAKLGQFAVDPARYPHSGVLLRQPNDKAGDPKGSWPGLRRLLVSYLGAASLRCQASRVGGVTGKIPVRRLRGRSRASVANPHPVGRLVPHPPDVAAQHCVLVPEHQQLSILGAVAAEHQDSQAEYPARQEVDDLE